MTSACNVLPALPAACISTSCYKRQPTPAHLGRQLLQLLAASQALQGAQLVHVHSQALAAAKATASKNTAHYVEPECCL